MSGILFRRPRRHANFARCNVILTEGQLLVFQSSLRKFTGEQIPQTQYDRQTVMNLQDCYVYSGLLTDSDLLYTERTFDSNTSTQRQSPRIYLGDGFTSSDDDTATCFVVWHNTRKTLFRRQEEKGRGEIQTKWRKVAALGVVGRSIVFKTRSRAERDLWVLAIESEIDRLQQRQDVRIVG